MIDSPFELGFRSIVESSLRPTEILNVICHLENEAENIEIESLHLDFLIPYLHQIYVSPSFLIRASVLRIISILEMKFSETICDKYNIDKLIASSIDMKPQNPPSKNDEEKSAAFALVLLLIKFRGYLPEAVIRSLISLYHSPKSTYKQLIIGIIAEGLLSCDDFPEYPDIYDIMADSLIDEPDEKLCGLIGYLNEHMKLTQKYCISKILLSLSSPFSPTTNYEAYKSIVYLLKTWTGVFFFGIQNNVFKDLLIILPYSTKTVLKIFSELILFNDFKKSIVGSFSGFVLFTLTKFGLFEILNDICENEDALKFINKYLSFVTHCEIPINISKPSYSKSNLNMESIQVNETILKISSVFDTPKIISSIYDFSFPQDESQWDWNLINSLITVVLPINDIDAQSTSAKLFYLGLLDFFCNERFLYIRENAEIITSTLLNLFEFLLSKEWGINVILQKEQLLKTITKGVEMLTSPSIASKNTQTYGVWNLFCLIISCRKGIELFTQWNFLQSFQNIGDEINDIRVAPKMIKMIRFYPESSIGVSLYLRFLLSSNFSISQIAINELEAKTKSLPNDVCFDILSQYFKMVDINDPKQEKQINILLNLISKLMIQDEQFLKRVSLDSKMHTILSKLSHNVYSLLLSNENALDLCNIDDEINWWIEHGNYEYVKVYDDTIKKVFDSDLEDLDHMLIPGHLYGELSKTKIGLQKLTKTIPSLLEKCNSDSIKERRVAFFALSHYLSNTNQYSKEIIQSMINSAYESQSYMLRGTLLSSLSIIVNNNKSMSRFLSSFGFRILSFKGNSWVFPNNLEQILIANEPKKHEFSEYQPVKLKYSEQISKLLNPIHISNAKKKLLEASRNTNSGLLNQEHALYANEIIAKYSFPNDTRQFLYSIFSQIPLENVPTDKYKINEEVASECTARLYEAQLQGVRHQNITFSQIKIPILKINDIKLYKRNNSVPEAYLNDNDFVVYIGKTKEEFYKLTVEEKNEIRKTVFRI